MSPVLCAGQRKVLETTCACPAGGLLDGAVGTRPLGFASTDAPSLEHVALKLHPNRATLLALCHIASIIPTSSAPRLSANYQ